jgi:hypothetical protein
MLVTEVGRLLFTVKGWIDGTEDITAVSRVLGADGGEMELLLEANGILGAGGQPVDGATSSDVITVLLFWAVNSSNSKAQAALLAMKPWLKKKY